MSAKGFEEDFDTFNRLLDGVAQSIERPSKGLSTIFYVYLKGAFKGPLQGPLKVYQKPLKGVLTSL